MSLFSRAASGQSLTPAERAMLKLIIGIILTALLAGLDAAVQYLTSPHDSVDWSKVLSVAVVAAVSSLAFALHKYVTAHGDIVIGAIPAQVTTATQPTPQPQNNTVSPAPVDSKP